MYDKKIIDGYNEGIELCNGKTHQYPIADTIRRISPKRGVILCGQIALANFTLDNKGVCYSSLDEKETEQ